MLLATTSEKRNTTEWVLDSDYKYHMCALGIDFQCMSLLILVLSLWAITANVILLGFVLYSDGVVRTLTKVCHISDKTQRHIYCGTVESNRYKYSVEGGVLKVSRRALVMIKGQKQGNLYILQDSTITGLAAVSVS